MPVITRIPSFQEFNAIVSAKPVKPMDDMDAKLRRDYKVSGQPGGIQKRIATWGQGWDVVGKP